MQNKQMRILSALTLAVAVVSFCGGCLLLLVRHTLQDDGVHELSVGKTTRRYTMHIPPAYRPGERVPLVVVLHGGGGNGRIAEAMSGYSRRADRDGFIGVYPYGTNRLFNEKLLTWNAGTCCGAARDQKVDDVTFIKQLILFMRSKYSISNVYVTGMSNGGMMAYRIGCELADMIDGIAPVAGAMNVQACHPVRPVNVIIFHGRSDRHVRYHGGRPEVNFDAHERLDRSVAYATSFWEEKNRCRDPLTMKSGTVERIDYTCEAAKLTVISIDDEGHTWPGGEKGRRGADSPTAEISATDEMLKFWKN